MTNLDVTESKLQLKKGMLRVNSNKYSERKMNKKRSRGDKIKSLFLFLNIYVFLSFTATKNHATICFRIFTKRNPYFYRKINGRQIL